jgi:hypothetical protein
MIAFPEKYENPREMNKRNSPLIILFASFQLAKFLIQHASNIKFQKA